MTKIKICGITREEDAALSVELGADFLGFVFVKESPRYVTAERAGGILGSLAPHPNPLPTAMRPRRGEGTGALAVGVFWDARLSEIRRVLEVVPLDLIQFHGSETDEDIAALGMPAIKAFRVAETLPDVTSSADWVMFDSGGGTGRTFDWTLLASYTRTKPFFLAGGITPQNVAAAVETVRPDAIDLSSGVESAPGIKDPQKLRDLFRRVRSS